MRRRFAFGGLAIVIAACLWFYPSAEADAPDPYNAETSFEHAQDAVFYLRALRSDGTASAVGTGVVIDAKGMAATAYHVVKGAASLEAIFESGRVVKGIKTLKFNEVTDAAIVQLPAPNAASEADYAYLPVRKETVRFGESVFAIGYPLKNTVIITQGIVNNPKASINGRDRILTSAEVVSGMSGGPLLDQQGRLAGIISGSLRTMDNIHLIIDMNDVRSLIDAVGKK